MCAFLMALFLGLSTVAIAQDPPEDPTIDVVEEDVTEEAVPGADADSTEEAVPEVPASGGDDEKAAEPEATTEGDAEKTDAVTDDGALETVGFLLDALKSKNWPLFVGLLLSLLVWAATRFGLKSVVGTKVLPWVTMGVAVVGTVGAALIAGLGIPDVLMQGVLAGVAAIGGWELILKHILPKKAVVPAEPAGEVPESA